MSIKISEYKTDFQKEPFFFTIIIYISEPNVYKNITITYDKCIYQRKVLSKVQGLDQKTQMIFIKGLFLFEI